MNLAERINAAISHKGIKRYELAEKMGFKAPMITAFKTGRARLTEAYAKKMAELLDVNMEWLLLGMNPPDWLGNGRKKTENKDEEILLEIKKTQVEINKTQIMINELHNTLKKSMK